MKLMLVVGLVSTLIGQGISPVFAQSHSEETLGLSGFVQNVIQKNAGLTAQELRAKAKQELIESADALDDPRISYAVAPSSIGDAIPSNFGNALGVRHVIQFSQALPWPGKRSRRKEEAEAQAEVAEYSYEELHLSLVNQSRLLWSQWWYTDAALATNARHQELLADLESTVSTQYANGLGLQQDVLKTQTAQLELEHHQFVLEQEKRRLRARLNNLLNQDPVTELGTLGDLALGAEIPEARVIRNWLLEAQPTLRLLEARADAAQSRVELTELEDYPDFQINMGYNELWNASALRYQVGVSVNIPLDFGKRSSRKSAARYEYASLLSDIEQLKSRLESELEQHLSFYDELNHNIHLFETELIPRAEQTFRAASANYEGSGGNFATLIDAQQVLLDLNLSLVRMQADKVMTLSEIDRLSGGRIWPVVQDGGRS